MPEKLCECGCGTPTWIPPYTVNKFGWKSGIPLRFKAGHYRRLMKPGAYPGVNIGNNKVSTIHRLRAIKALGKPLPEGAEVHHVKGDRDPNGPLVICQDSAYHNFLHYRMRIVKAGFNPDTHRRCSRCREHKSLDRFHRAKSMSMGLSTYCQDCARQMQREYFARKAARTAVAS